ncbi:MAG: Yip1 family protein [Vicinamibacterales bacterium]
MTATLRHRVTQMLRAPQSEWSVIAAEPETVTSLYSGYIAIMAAIGPVILFLRHPGPGSFIAAVAQYLLQFAAVFICVRVIEWLAPRFRSDRDRIGTLKLVAYANTPSWVAGIAHLLPWLAPLVLFAAALYGIYLYYLGLPVLLHTPYEQVVPFMLVSAIVIMAVMLVLSLLV